MSRLDLDAAARARLRERLAGDLDWTLLLELASRHRLGPLLYRHVNAAAPTLVPRQAFIDLWRSHEINVRRSEALATELARLLDRLAAAGIRALAYKGPVLALSLYGDLALREYEDLDILVDRDQLLEAKGLLEADGYEPDYPLEPHLERAFLGAHAQFHRALVHRETGLLVELHWRSDADFPVESTADPTWWASRPMQRLLGRDVRGFSRDELLLVLCLHATRHQGYRLAWLAEIAELIRQGPLDWPWITTTTARLSCTRRVGVSLLLARRLLGAELPVSVQRTLDTDAAVTALASRLEARLFVKNVGELRALERLAMSLRFYDRQAHRLAHLHDVSLAPSLKEWSQWPLPTLLFPLYVPLRLMRLAAKYGAGLFGRGQATEAQ